MDKLKEAIKDAYEAANAGPGGVNWLLEFDAVMKSRGFIDAGDCDCGTDAEHTPECGYVPVGAKS